MTDINKVLLTGVIGEPRLRWLESGKPELRLSLTVEQEGGFKLYVQGFCYGNDCERLAETLQAGSRVLIDGRLSWRSTVKSGVKESKRVVSCYGVEVLTTPGAPVAARSDEAEGNGGMPDEQETPREKASAQVVSESSPRGGLYPESELSAGVCV